jgi:hypothetical protein
VFLSTAQGQLATIQDSFHAPAAVQTVTDAEDTGRDLGVEDGNAAETSVVSEAGADDSIIA